tara:strand:- start:668 stop:1993 length:1326 start_codon:yes stop_codon:yes gene_type:complete
MFNQLKDQFQSIFRNIRGLGKITELNVRETVRQVRRSLLDADVNFKVVKSFTSRIEKKVIGTKVLNTIKPGEQFIKIIRDELTILLKSENSDLILNNSPSIILMVGLQGAGKTTTAAKLALKLKNNNMSMMLVAADTNRPAAVDQLKKLGEKINVPVYYEKIKNSLIICKNAINKARSLNTDVLIIDTAGRLHNDNQMMAELKEISLNVKPDETLLVVDGMTGQDAVAFAKKFNIELPVSGLVLTKMDGNSRAGAALSIKEVTGIPIKYIGNSESLEGIEQFHAKRTANRILGFGDVVSLVEKAERAFDNEKMLNLNEKIDNGSFDLDDFRYQIIQIKKMGPINQILELIPGLESNILKKMNYNDQQINWTEAIINSMTPHERKMPEIIDGSRRLRISKGSGRAVQEVNMLLKQYFQMKKMMKKIKKQKKIMLPNMVNLGN